MALHGLFCGVQHSHCEAPGSSKALDGVNLSFLLLNRCAAVSHCGFNWHFPEDQSDWAFFMCLFTIRRSTSVCSNVLPNFLLSCLSLSFMNSFCIPGTSLFIRQKFCNYLFPVYGLTFHPLQCVFWRAEAFNFKEDQFINLVFVDLIFSVISKKYMLSPKSFLLFSSRDFVI